MPILGLGNMIFGWGGGSIPINEALIAGWKFETIIGSDEFDNAVSDYAVHPITRNSAIYYNGKTYITYMGNDCDPYIITYTHSTGLYSLPVKCGTNPLTNTDNDHAEPSMVIDSLGYIHIIFGAHNSKGKYVKSTNPEDITSWSDAIDHDVGSYFQFVKFSTNKIYLFYRRQTAPTCEWVYVTSDNNCESWSAVTIISTYYSYLQFIKGQGDFIHVSINGYETTAFDRFNAYYFNFDGTLWKNGAGSTLTLPLDATDAADILVHNSGANYIPWTTLAFDASNNPFIFFTESTSAAEISTYNYKIAKYSAGWNIVSMGVATDRFQDYTSAIEVTSTNNLTAFLITGGTADAIGGNIQRWASTDNGDTWGLIETIKTGQLWCPVIVRDYNVNARIVFCNYRATNTSWLSKVYLWGNNGIVRNETLASGVVGIRTAYPLLQWGNPVQVAGKYGSAFSFTGTPQHMYATDNDIFSFNGGSPDKPFSVTFWLNSNSTVANQHIVGKGVNSTNAEWRIYIVSGTIGFMAAKQNITAYRGRTAPFTTTGSWVFICCTYDGSGLVGGFKIYADNIQIDDTDVTTGTYAGMTNGNSHLYVATYGNTNYYLNGLLDELKIWNAVLSDEEMTLIMNNTPGW